MNFRHFTGVTFLHYLIPGTITRLELGACTLEFFSCTTIPGFLPCGGDQMDCRHFTGVFYWRYFVGLPDTRNHY